MMDVRTIANGDMELAENPAAKGSRRCEGHTGPGELTHSDIGISYSMARAPTTTDVFNAIAEPRRRQIIDALASGEERAVGDLVRTLDLPQPVVSKHLAVLREVGILSVSRRGRQRLYRLDGKELKPVHDWIKEYERFWSHQLHRIKERAERKARDRAGGAAE